MRPSLTALREFTPRISFDQVALLCFRAVWSHAGKKHLLSNRTLAAVCVLAPPRGSDRLLAGNRGCRRGLRCQTCTATGPWRRCALEETARQSLRAGDAEAIDLFGNPATTADMTCRSCKRTGLFDQIRLA
jgi:hypothetical protein